MTDPVKLVSNAEQSANAAVARTETEAVGFFSQAKPLWWVIAAAVVGLIVGWVL